MANKVIQEHLILNNDYSFKSPRSYLQLQHIKFSLLHFVVANQDK